MPNKANAKKALRQAKKHMLVNVQIKKTYRDALKTARKAVEEGKEGAHDLTKIAQKQLDKAAKRGVIKKKTAARKLSRLMKKMSKIAKK